MPKSIFFLTPLFRSKNPVFISYSIGYNILSSYVHTLILDGTRGWSLPFFRKTRFPQNLIEVSDFIIDQLFKWIP